MTLRRVCAAVLCGGSLLAALALFAGHDHRAPQQGAPPARHTAAASQATAASSAAGLPPVPPSVAAAQRLDVPGIQNFARVSPTLFRGAQPKAEGYQELKKLGVEIVVNFRDERGKIESERREVESHGMRYVSIPFGTLQDPNNQQVEQFLALLRENPDKKVFVHCHLGADRTGVMVAIYRIADENWTPQQALEEMRSFHYHHFWWPHFQRYVENFPTLLASEPALRGLTPAAHASAP